MIHLRLSAGLAAALLLSPLPAAAKDIVVHMKNQGADGAMEVEKVPVVPQTEQQKKIIEDNQ